MTTGLDSIAQKAGIWQWNGLHSAITMAMQIAMN